MTTDWAHLPNAPHIDRVIASVKAHPDQWVGGRGVAWNTEWDAGRSAEYNAAWLVAREAALEAALEAAWWAARYFAQYAILALVAYDDCAYMLDSDPGELAILAAFGDPRAVLLLPACKALQSIKEVV